jgi:hypothetical protein
MVVDKYVILSQAVFNCTHIKQLIPVHVLFLFYYSYKDDHSVYVIQKNWVRIMRS